MPKFISLDLQKLTPSELKIYQELVDKPFWPCLKGHDPWGVSTGEIFAAAALTEAGSPIGLALAVYYRYNALALLLSLHFQKTFATAALNAQLLSQIVGQLAEQKCSLITHTYSSMASNAAELEQLFKEAGWGLPQLVIIRCHFDLQAFSPAWFCNYQRIALPAGIDILPWKEITSNERNQLIEKQAIGSFREYVSPFHEEETIDSSNSLVARYQGEMIGWIILHRVGEDTIRFSAFYVDREFRFSKVPGALLVTAITLAQKTKIPKAIFEFNLEQVDRHWVDFVKKRLAPYAEQIERIYEIGFIFR